MKVRLLGSRTFLYLFPIFGYTTTQEVVNMVMGISRQVIVVQAPEPKLFEQAIFILKDDALGQDGVTDDLLLQEAQKLIRSSCDRKKRRLLHYGPVWACFGAALTALFWLLSTLA